LPEAAVILRRQGQPDSSVVLLEKALSRAGMAYGWSYEAGWYAQALSQLGELYEARGDRARAADYYGRYVTLLKDAEPPLAAQVVAVREKLTRVTSEPAPKR
jgi:tetratricopeptide (TPR) repeat protein